MTLDATAQHVLRLYREHARQFLAEHQAASMDGLDQTADLLERAIARTGQLSIGFVGESQVGKSTLINALLDRHALPSGGIGPLTAQATRVTYADEESLTVTYHGRQELNRHAFAVARLLERRDGKAPATSDRATEPSIAELEADDRLAMELAMADDQAPQAQTALSELGKYMLDQARRILCDDNPAVNHPLTDYQLLDAMRALVSQKPVEETKAPAELHARVVEARRLIAAEETVSQTAEGGRQQFNKALRQRAAGWMSPLVSSLTLRLKSPASRGLTLVDLPGIGVLNDPAGKEAERFVTNEGDALVVVFRNSGVTVNIAELLERTGVITKLLFGGEGTVPPIQVILCVTHLDDVARERYRSLSQDAKDNGTERPDRHRVFEELSREMVVKIRSMIGDALRQSASFHDLGPDERQARERVIASLCESLAVFCVAAPDYMSVTEGDDEGFLRDANVTQVPALREHLLDLARNAADRRQQAISQLETSLRDSVRNHLSAISKMYEEGQGPATRDFERFRDALVAAAEPLRHDMRAYHGEALGVLRKGMQSEISLMCKDAEIAGMRKLQRLSRDGRSSHFMSLNAALVRSGVWERRGLNYPEALTLAMVDSIASQWEPKIVEKVRGEVRTLADRDLQLVERLCEAARAANPKIVADSPIEEQKKVLQANSRSAVAWTREQLEELRETVRTTLRATVEKPIERACLKAVRAGANLGTGAKNRILTAFEEGGEAAIVEAREAAEKALMSHYNALIRKLNEGFLKENHDPVQATVDTLTGEQVTKARRADAQKKRVVTSRVAELTRRLDEAA